MVKRTTESASNKKHPRKKKKTENIPTGLTQNEENDFEFSLMLEFKLRKPVT
jgi:hypothetical protein